MRTHTVEVRRWCESLGGVARTAELARVGVDRHSLRAALDAGEVRRVREGVYATPDTGADVITAVLHGGTLGCVSRLQAEGLWLIDRDDRVHVSMPPTGRRRPHDDCECAIHWTASTNRGGMASIGDALVQVLQCQGAEHFFVALESAMRERRLSRSELQRLRGRLQIRHRHLVDFARWDADSGLESLLRLRLRPSGLDPASQVRIPGVGRVDFVLDDLIVIEVDGVPGHADSPGSRHKDLVRDAVASAHGLETLRFDYALVVYDWPLVEAAILAAVDRARRRRARRVVG
ncbi:type IV toxin-antitoxin system AbiEi family antitoxin domain-containing protein [Agromyces sp. NPDC057679]|uniref:type IV toxin-antitoxin system AbiEi family antitoxin domain-containing protein n=1 Tax=Agromyces sp. NPDC057679 TaxID=3346207 RepID=UPI0036709C3F